MIIGTAPMMRTEWMSVRLGMVVQCKWNVAKFKTARMKHGARNAGKSRNDVVGRSGASRHWLEWPSSPLPSPPSEGGEGVGGSECCEGQVSARSHPSPPPSPSSGEEEEHRRTREQPP